MGGQAKDEAAALQAMQDVLRAQPHTFPGERGDTVVEVKMRDVYFAVLEGIRRACGADTVDAIDLEGVDEIAIAQNACCAVEEVVGIFPNIRGRQFARKDT